LKLREVALSQDRKGGQRSTIHEGDGGKSVFYKQEKNATMPPGKTPIEGRPNHFKNPGARYPI